MNILWKDHGADRVDGMVCLPCLAIEYFKCPKCCNTTLSEWYEEKHCTKEEDFKHWQLHTQSCREALADEPNLE
jgi:hypothetical protein